MPSDPKPFGDSECGAGRQPGDIENGAGGVFEKMDLVTREEFDIQALLARTREKDGARSARGRNRKRQKSSAANKGHAVRPQPGLDGLAPAVAAGRSILPGPAFVTLVGLPDTEVRARDRVRAALINLASSFRPAASPSISRRPTFPGIRAVSTCRSRSAFCRLGNSPPNVWTATSSPASCRYPERCGPFAAHWRWCWLPTRRGAASSCRKDSAAEAALVRWAGRAAAGSLFAVCAHLRGEGELQPAAEASTAGMPRQIPPT